MGQPNINLDIFLGGTGYSKRGWREPPPVDWPYWWSAEQDDILQLTDCICGYTGWLPDVDGETMVACHVCNNQVPAVRT